MAANMIFSDNEVLRLHDHLMKLENEPRWRPRIFFVRFMLATGLKLREALPIRMGDILLNYDPPVIFVKNTTAGATNRFVQINSAWCPEFRSYIEALKKHRSSDALLFRGRVPDRPNARESLIGWWKEVMSEAGLRHVSIEKTRGRIGVWESKRLPPLGLM